MTLWVAEARSFRGGGSVVTVGIAAANLADGVEVVVGAHEVVQHVEAARGVPVVVRLEDALHQGVGVQVPHDLVALVDAVPVDVLERDVAGPLVGVEGALVDVGLHAS